MCIKLNGKTNVSVTDKQLVRTNENCKKYDQMKINLINVIWAAMALRLEHSTANRED